MKNHIWVEAWIGNDDRIYSITWKRQPYDYWMYKSVMGKDLVIHVKKTESVTMTYRQFAIFHYNSMVNGSLKRVILD